MPITRTVTAPPYIIRARTFQGENVCCPTGGIAYFDVDQDSAACCSEDYLYDVGSGTTIQTVCNGTTQLLESKVCSSCGGEDVYLGAVIKDNQPVDKNDINTTETGSSLCCKNSADIYGYFDGAKRLIHYGDMNVNNNCDMSSIYVDDNNYYGICGDGRIFYVNDDTDEVSCCNLSDGSVLAYRLTGSPAVFDDRFSLTLDGLTKYPLRGRCLSSSEDNATTEETSTTIPETTVTDDASSPPETTERGPHVCARSCSVIGMCCYGTYQCGRDGKVEHFYTPGGTIIGNSVSVSCPVGVECFIDMHSTNSKKECCIQSKYAQNENARGEWVEASDGSGVCCTPASKSSSETCCEHYGSPWINGKCCLSPDDSEECCLATATMTNRVIYENGTCKQKGRKRLRVYNATFPLTGVVVRDVRRR